MDKHPLPIGFFYQDPLTVASQLLGKILERKIDNQILSGRIVEVEAYLADQDPASHAYRGPTKRNASLYLPGGHAYIYTIHQQHCMDIAIGDPGTPYGILIRALEPLTGIELMQQHRKQTVIKSLTSGPGKLTQALSITRQLDGYNLTNPNGELVILDDGFDPQNITSAPRIGISHARDLKYRFYITGNQFVSKL